MGTAWSLMRCRTGTRRQLLLFSDLDVNRRWNRLLALDMSIYEIYFSGPDAWNLREISPILGRGTPGITLNPLRLLLSLNLLELLAHLQS